MKKHPSTFKQRFKKRMKRGDQNTNKEEADNDNDNDNNNDNDNDDDDNENQIETVDQNNDDKTLSNKQSIDNKANIDRDVLKNELNRSAIEDIGHVVYEFHKKFFNVITHFKKIEMAHTQFVEKEYFSIIKILGGENDIGLLYNKNIDILNEQIEKDQQIIQDIFSPYFNKIKMRDTPKEESFEDAKNKGTSYIMKETESVREIKVTLQMKDDLKTIIEQDF